MPEMTALLLPSWAAGQDKRQGSWMTIRIPIVLGTRQCTLDPLEHRRSDPLIILFPHFAENHFDIIQFWIQIR